MNSKTGQMKTMDKKMKVTNVLLALWSIWFCGAWSSSMEGCAMSTADYIEALKPSSRPVKGQRGVGGTSFSSSAQDSLEVALRLQFAKNSAELSPDAVAHLHTLNAVSELQNLAAALEDESLRQFKYLVEGHTCDLGTAEHNLELSQKRAYAVAEWLTKNTSLSPEQFEVSWYGESSPVVANTDENARKENRRVVIKNTQQKVAVSLKSKPATLQISRYKNGQKEIVNNGDTLHSGEHYSLAFQTASMPYAYVCQMDSSGEPVLLFPNPENLQQKNPVAPGSTYQMPGGSELFYLDETTGTEHLVLMVFDAVVEDPLLSCKTAFQGDTVAQRGVGGVGTIAPPPAANAPAVREEDNNLQLCEIMPNGKTRGLGGISKPNQAISSSIDDTALQDNACKGYFLKRFFIHE